MLYDHCVLSYTQFGACALHYAARKNSTSLIDYFINAGIDVNVVDEVSRDQFIV